MLTNTQAELLLEIPKFIVIGNQRRKNVTIEQPHIWRQRFSLVGNLNNEAVEFLWEIWQGSKNTLKMSLHFQEDDMNIGIFRVDFWSGHKNPFTITEQVPEKFHPYIGKHFLSHEHHVHYHVEGYPPLAWAVPIEDDNFPYKETTDRNLPDIVEAFARTIHLQTKLTITRRII
ncbi:MAG: hypothetical protein D6681_19460 [Calditrichaeota bacterium]|nr:MAG: hypothetical protein D6681_19460 [Calditrichota bacterium]